MDVPCASLACQVKKVPGLHRESKSLTLIIRESSPALLFDLQKPGCCKQQGRCEEKVIEDGTSLASAGGAQKTLSVA